MNWSESFAVLFALVGLATMFHGFPSIKIGGQHHQHHHYHKLNEEEE